MKQIFKKILECDDIQVVKNCISIIAEYSETGMSNGCMLEMLKSLQSEISSCNYDEETADLHLCLIKQLHTKDVAKDFWREDIDERINKNDWFVLWGEMVRQNESKIKKWFPGIKLIGYECKIFEECLNFLSNGKLPYCDLNA